MRKQDVKVLKIGSEIHGDGIEKLAKSASDNYKPKLSRDLAAERTQMLDEISVALSEGRDPDGEDQRAWVVASAECYVKKLRKMAKLATGLGKTDDAQRYGDEADDLEQRLIPQFDDRPQLSLKAEPQPGDAAGEPVLDEPVDETPAKGKKKGSKKPAKAGKK